MGADRKLVRWERIVEYFWKLDESPCVRVEELGKSTEGNPFLLAVVSSPENLGNAEKLRDMSYRIAHPKGMTDAEVESMRVQLTDILARFQSLAEVDTEGVEPTGHSTDMHTVMRGDAPKPSLPRSDVLANAPAEDGAFSEK